MSLLDWESLAAEREGLFCLTACLCGPLSTALSAENEALALERMGKLKEIFGENLAVELMDHGIEVEQKNIPRLIDLAKKENVPTVATNDCHYVNEDEGAHHRLYYRLCRGRTVPDENKTDDFYIKTPEEMLQTKLPPESIAQSFAIAEQIENYDLSQLYGDSESSASNESVGLLRVERYSPAQALVKSARLMGVPLQLIQSVSGPESNTLSFDQVLDRASAIRTAGERLPHLVPFARNLEGMIRCYEVDEEHCVAPTEQTHNIPLRRFGQVLLAQFDEAGCRSLGITTRSIESSSPMGQAIAKESEYRKGVQWYNRRRLDKAQKCFQAVLSRDGQHVDALYQMGLVYAIRNKHDRAITCFKKVLDLDPAFERMAFLQSWLGWSYYKMDQHRNALKSFEISTKIHPTLPGSLYGLGLLKFEKGDRNEAAEILERFIAVSPPPPQRGRGQKDAFSCPKTRKRDGLHAEITPFRPFLPTVLRTRLNP